MVFLYYVAFLSMNDFFFKEERKIKSREQKQINIALCFKNINLLSAVKKYLRCYWDNVNGFISRTAILIENIFQILSDCLNALVESYFLHCFYWYFKFCYLTHYQNKCFVHTVFVSYPYNNLFSFTIIGN